jgi:hypothetical protein
MCSLERLNRSLSMYRIWDTRKLEAMSAAGTSSKVVESLEFDSEAVTSYCTSDAGHGSLRAEWAHDKSVSSAFWDTRGRSIVSTSYDDNIRSNPLDRFYGLLAYCCRLQSGI